MPRLFLLRHAKSSLDDPARSDRDRPLAPRGVRAADMMGEHLRSSGIEPTVVLCSPATRARETFAGLGVDWDAQFEPELYGASEGGLLTRLRRLGDEVESALVI